MKKYKSPIKWQQIETDNIIIKQILTIGNQLIALSENGMIFYQALRKPKVKQIKKIPVNQIIYCNPQNSELGQEIYALKMKVNKIIDRYNKQL